MQRYDVIVIGIGGMGSAALWQVAQRGQRVLGLERFDLGHAMGSSHGLNRIIRLAYFEHADYIPLLRRAYQLWRQTEQAAGIRLLTVTGRLDLGPHDSRIVRGALASCRQHDLPHEVLNGIELMRRYPGYRIPSDFVAVYQRDAGFIASEAAILAHASLASAAGAQIRCRERVLTLEQRDGHVVVVTDQARYLAGKVIASAGGWIGDLIPRLRHEAVPERQVLGWFQPRNPELFTPERFPVSNLLSPMGHYYQLPTWGIPGLKIGLYHHRLQEAALGSLAWTFC